MYTIQVESAPPFLCPGDSEHGRRERPWSQVSPVALFLHHLRLTQQCVGWDPKTVGLPGAERASLCCSLVASSHIIYTPFEV